MIYKYLAFWRHSDSQIIIFTLCQIYQTIYLHCILFLLLITKNNNTEDKILSISFWSDNIKKKRRHNNNSIVIIIPCRWRVVDSPFFSFGGFSMDDIFARAYFAQRAQVVNSKLFLKKILLAIFFINHITL